MKKINIVLLRKDLRINDNPALVNASDLPTVVVFPAEARPPKGSAARVWLGHSLASLNQQLSGKLYLAAQPMATFIRETAAQFNIQGLYMAHGLSAEDKAFEQTLMPLCQQLNIELHFTDANLLWDLQTLQKADQSAYKVFSAFYRHAQKQPLLKQASQLNNIELLSLPGGALETEFVPEMTSVWGKKIIENWPGSAPGEPSAQQRWRRLCQQAFNNYQQGRNIPSQINTSLLSAAIEWGELSVRQMHHDLCQLSPSDDIEHFKSELAWRAFSHYLLRDYPHMDRENINPKFNHFPWLDNPLLLHKWQQGLTGIPIVDAGMRELWHTGYMHNRVRMITASLLVKNLLIPWQHGCKWFEQTLFDASPANNSASWQWVAGSGMDAAPYFRIFNPVTQSERFDKNTDYLCKWLPQLEKLPPKYRHAPWQAPNNVLQSCDFVLARDYPHPIVDLKDSRQNALSAYQNLKQLGKLQ
ncbi:deoxyribodipyrimidine photo-lyase [Paraferrimonas sp. SM1919]|uniref:cryptochrome/photolyase family protein n=1 Tax=Paraferrimonas sp. SM1919 TaxID=2662263 RepID=UPI0013CF67A3|nr:deoxyribodipyrimidine photo-lyase [Paraferrimonas sp. SM1919]